jgi:uncharacterized glyoxalase superfamily protein PhnB
MSRPSIFPALRYADGRGAIDWLVRVFGFEETAVFANKDGSIAHAELRLGSAVVGLSSAHEIPGNPWSAVRQGLYVHVPEVDAHHDRARAAGAEIVMPLTNMDYGSREYGARDTDGHLWGFGTYNMTTGNEGEGAAVFPEIQYHDGAKAMRFLAEAFGFAQTLLVPGPNGSVRHAEMRFGGGTIFVGSGPDETGVWGSQTMCTHVYVDDPDGHFARASAGSATIVQPLHDTPWGSRGYVARDVEGFLWGFSTYRPGVSVIA